MLQDAPIRKVPGDLPRKWISDDYFDLIVWYRDEEIAGFQLCYGKPYEERAVTWFSDGRISHSRVDSGDNEATANRTPLLIPEASFPKEQIIGEFAAKSGLLEPEIRNLVLEKLRGFGAV